MSGKEQIADHGNVCDGRLRAYHERSAREMGLENGEEVIDTPAQKTEHGLIRGWGECALKAVRGYVPSELVIVPEQPSKDLEPVVVGVSRKFSIALGK
jgi:hypothetical protein